MTYSLGPLGMPALFAALATVFACGSSDVDEPQGSAGMGGAGASGASGAAQTGAASGEGGSGTDAGSGGVMAEASGSAGMAGAGGGEPIGNTAGNTGDEGGSAGAPSTWTPVLELSGAITNVHDPSIIKDGDTFYLFSTGQGIQLRVSKDLRVWQSAGQIFATKPAWITTTDASDPNNLWAPEVRFFGGKFHLFYAASKFGSNVSCIGHATKTALGSADSWVDLGALFCSNVSGPAQDFNALDPDPFEDQQGKLWLSFGSFWSGLKLFRLDSDGLRDGPDFFSLATRDNTAVEAPHLHYHDGFYFLFESVDFCCQGINSTYKIMVGRSSEVSGPYLDQSGALLSDGGGTLVLQGAGRWRGPGHNAILQDGARTYNVYHSYDANNGGIPTLRISELTWSSDNWPISAGP